ncbi:MAG: glycosyltransferase family 4 protein [Actinobacteria bacterium]|nr:glycosyltransferase family 4 protein [Actinomycetota bacterium]
MPNPLKLNSALKGVFKENDIIHVWEYYYPYSVMAILLRLFNKKKKLILTTDGFVGYSYKPRGLTFLFKIYTNLFAKFLFKIPDKITTYGKSMIFYAKQAGISNIRIIPTGIDLKKFKVGNAKKVIKEFKIKKNEFLILFIGMLTERKRADYVIKLSERLIMQGYNVKTLIVGDGPLKEDYQKMISDKKDIILVGSRENVIDFLLACDVLLLPSLGEGLPGVVMEAMACGKPVIATNEGCTPDLVKNGENGFLINENDFEGFYNALKTLILNKKLRLKFGENGRLKIKKFDWKIIYKNYFNLYDNLLKNERVN